jgi:tetratricopeptide (TPR) repeat protein
MSQKKQELVHNELAGTIESHFEKVKPYLSQIILLTTAVILGVLAVAVWMYTRHAASEGQWEDFLYSTQLAEIRGMEDVAKTYPDTPAGQFALIRVADYDFNRGASNIITDRDDFKDKVRKAIERYETLADGPKVDPFIKRRAVFALGHSYESIGEFDRAREYYQQLIENAPEDPITVLARKGVKRLGNATIVGIYEKFKTWAPPETAPESNPLVPSRPDISFPSASDREPPAEAAPAGVDGDSKAPKAESETPNPEPAPGTTAGKEGGEAGQPPAGKPVDGTEKVPDTGESKGG